MNFIKNITSIATTAIETASEKAKDAITDGTDIYNNMKSKIANADIVGDIEKLHAKSGHKATADAMDSETLSRYLELRMKMIEEEFNEIKTAYAEKNADDFVDGVIDNMVFLAGTLDLMGVDITKAWNAVQAANMAKETGVKPGRPNPFGLQDLVKPEGWVAPSHEDNVGRLTEVFKNNNE